MPALGVLSKPTQTRLLVHPACFLAGLVQGHAHHCFKPPIIMWRQLQTAAARHAPLTRSKQCLRPGPSCPLTRVRPLQGQGLPRAGGGYEGRSCLKGAG